MTPLFLRRARDHERHRSSVALVGCAIGRATQAIVESLVIRRTSLFMVDRLGSLEGTSLNDVATRVEEFPLHVFARPGSARRPIHQRCAGEVPSVKGEEGGHPAVG
jgi:hypothetical protein